MSSSLRYALWPAMAALGGLIAYSYSIDLQSSETLSSMQGQHLYWYLGRAGGFVAFVLLFASVVLGLAVSSRVFDGMLARPWVFEMHQFLSIFMLLAMFFHVLILLPDPYAQFKLEELFVPLQARYRPVPLAIGIVVLYGSVIVSASFYLKRFIGQKGWRKLHYVSFALFVGALLHGVFSGTDSSESWTKVFYLGAGVLVLFFTFFRVLASKRVERAEKAAAVKQPVGTMVNQGAAAAR
jgi:predicted ferric reductase